MLYATPQNNSVDIYDSNTQQRKYSMPVNGEVAGAPIINGDQMAIPVRVSDTQVVTRVYDIHSGQLKYTNY